MEAMTHRLKRASANIAKKRLVSGEYIEVDGRVRPNPEHENYYKYCPEKIESIISDEDVATLLSGNSIKVLTEAGEYIILSVTKE